MGKLAKFSAIVLGTFAASQALAQDLYQRDFHLMLGLRATEADNTLGYGSLTGKLQRDRNGGLYLRADAETSKVNFGGTRWDQDEYRLLLGYAFPISNGEMMVLAGPTRVERTYNGGFSDISDTGLYAALEGYGYIGARGFWGGIIQWSDPAEEFFARAYGTYLVGGNTNIGPDVSYLNEPDYHRTTLGIRSTWTFQNAAVSAIVGVERQSGSAASSENDAFIEMQLNFNF